MANYSRYWKCICLHYYDD